MGVEDVAGETIKILAAAGVGWPALVAGALIVALAILAWRVAPRLPGDSTPHDHRDDSVPATDKPDAQWGTNDGPPGGGMEGG